MAFKSLLSYKPGFPLVEHVEMQFRVSNGTLTVYKLSPFSSLEEQFHSAAVSTKFVFYFFLHHNSLK